MYGEGRPGTLGAQVKVSEQLRISHSCNLVGGGMGSHSRQGSGLMPRKITSQNLPSATKKAFVSNRERGGISG